MVVVVGGSLFLHGRTYHIIPPDNSLRLQLGAVAHLQSARAPSGEEVCDLLPGQVFGFLQLHQQGVIFGCELQLGALWSRRWRRHAGLADDAGRTVVILVVRRG